ncbi:MAG: hypothetical protein JWO03_1588 [Bacteroidetes bacterium]|nr:hypothetical protein [Bacteroidota bacterium]
MKLLLISILIFTAFVTRAQTNHTSIMFRHPVLDGYEFSSIASSPQYFAQKMPIYGDHSADNSDYREGRRKRNGGIALTVIGATFITGGSVLMSIGVPGIKNDINSNASTHSYVVHGAEIGGGGLALLAGIPMTISGLVKIIKGSNGMHRNRSTQPHESTTPQGTVPQ